MDIGIGLPNTVPGTEGRTFIDWARHAEEAGFSTLGTIGRLVYPNYEELIALSAAAAVSPEMVKSYMAAFEASGCDEIIFVPTASRLDQVSLLAEAIA